jgi:hypothetical protein
MGAVAGRMVETVADAEDGKAGVVAAGAMAAGDTVVGTAGAGEGTKLPSLQIYAAPHG